MGIILSTSKSSDKRRQPTREEQLSKRGVLIPPSFGVGIDFVPPPSSFASSGSCSTSAACSCGSVRSSVPHLVLSSRTRSGSVIRSLVHVEDAASRLLGSEHVRPGIWVSATTPNLGGNATAGGHASNREGWRGFLSGVSVTTLSSRKSGSVAGAGVTLSTSSDVVGNESASSSSFGGDASAFVSQALPCWCGGGVLSSFVSASGSDASGDDDFPLPSSDSVASSVASVRSLVSPRGTSRGGDVSAGRFGRVGWNYSTSFELEPTSKQQSKQVEYYRNDPFSDSGIKATGTTSVGVNLGYSTTFAKPSEDFPPESRSPLTIGPYDMTHLSSHLSVDVLRYGTKAAFEADVPVSSISHLDMKRDQLLSSPSSLVGAVKGLNPFLSYYASFDLNRAAGLPDDDSTGPPIVVTLHKIDGRQRGATEAAATISQTVTFDRLVANPLEERCPRIRNTIAWAVRMTHRSFTSTTSGLLGERSKTEARTDLSAAAAWQVNRGLGYKVRFDAREGWTFGILLKRWAHPRVAASLLFGTDTNNSRVGGGSSGINFKGIGIQIETGPLPGQRRPGLLDGVGAMARVGADGRYRYDAADLIYGAAGAAGSSGADEGPPATRAELP